MDKQTGKTDPKPYMLKNGLPGLLILVFLLSACAPAQTPEPTPSATPLPTSTPAPTDTHTPAPSPTATRIFTKTPTSTRTPTPTEYPYSTLPGWFTYIDWNCRGLCNNISICKADFSEQKRVTDHDYGFVMELLWSPNARYIAYSFVVLGEDGGYQIRLLDLQTNQMSILNSKFVDEPSGFSWSPDSRSIVVGYKNEGGAGGKIQRFDAQTKQVANLTKDLAAQEITPAYSPDGKTIVFSAKNPDGTGSIWLMNANGSGLQNLSANPEGRDMLPIWSPDGSEIVFYHQGTGQVTDLWKINADGSNPHLILKLGKATVVEPARWSPDGSKLGIISGDEKSTQVQVLVLEDGTVMDITEKDRTYTGISWSPDSQAFIYLKGSEDVTKEYISLFVFAGDDPFSVDADGNMNGAVWSPGEIP